MELPVPASSKQEKIKLTEINAYLTCYLCKGYLVDATTISECLHSFCRSCIIKFLQDNSYCPVCELIINKTKPNLKTDKTLQDIVYKLVPELFLREMLRRRSFYKDYPQIAARVSPEERGEDTERTIFNPQEMISLSLEYICDDSTPGALRIPGIATILDTSKTGDGQTAEEDDGAQIKRYLLCPGMCRVEVLKKFVRNKYNVDTNQFFIDLLYKRVPLPDHYTLIDIAYIYSWQRNEVMKFFFRIIDQNKAKRTDSPVNTAPQFITRNFKRTKSTTDRVKAASPEKKSHRKSTGKIHGSKRSSQEKAHHGPKPCAKQNEQKSAVKCESEEPDLSRLSIADASEEKCDSEVKVEKTVKEESRVGEVKVEKTSEGVCENKKVKPVKIILSKAEKGDVVSKKLDREKLTNGCDVPKEPARVEESSEPVKAKVEKSEEETPVIKKEPVSPESEKSDNRLILKVSKDFMDNVNIGSSKSQVFSKPVTKSFTSITLNRSENVEIITKIEPVSNKDGHAIGHHIIKQTIKKGSKIKNSSPKKMSPKLNIPTLVIKKKSIKKKSPKREMRRLMHDLNIKEKPVQIKVEPADDVVMDKSKFLEYMRLKPVVKKEEAEKPKQAEVKCEVKQEVPKKQQIVISRAEPKQSTASGQKRKSTSPLKNDKAKQPRLIESKKPVKIILQDKRPKSDGGLQSLINSCKIPSSLSITIKEGSDKGSLPPVAPPVKNFIEILKLPEDPEPSSPEIKTKLDLTKFCDKDSEQKVDEDLAEIAKSLTEKIPMSTTVSQIIGPKENFAIPVKTNLPAKPQIQPSPVPEVSKAVSEQSFQKIFEESLKKPPESAAEDKPSSTSNKRNILEIASELFKKTKKEEDKPLPKVPIPRLPSQKLSSAFNSKFIPQTVASLHSSSLGLNYTVSVGQQSPTKVMKSNGIVSPVKVEPDSSEFKVPSPSPKLPAEVPVNPPKASPKSSPAVKSAFGVTNKPLSPPMSRPPRISPRPNKPKPVKSPKTSPLAASSSHQEAANDLLAKYNIPNLAQLTANFNPAMMAANNQLAAFQQAVLLKHFELQNRQNWLNMNQGPLMQYEKYLESLKGGMNGSHGHT